MSNLENDYLNKNGCCCKIDEAYYYIHRKLCMFCHEETENCGCCNTCYELRGRTILIPFVRFKKEISYDIVLFLYKNDIPDTLAIIIANLCGIDSFLPFWVYYGYKCDKKYFQKLILKEKEKREETSEVS